MSQEVKSLNFAAEENYTVRLCKELVAYHYPDELPLGSFELLASNKIRSDEETVGARDHPRLEYSRFLMGGLLTPPPLERERGRAERGEARPQKPTARYTPSPSAAARRGLQRRRVLLRPAGRGEPHPGLWS